MDAYKAWFSRMDPTSAPLGHAVKWFAAEGAADEGRAQPRFRGYVMSKEGVPTFLYRVGERAYRLRWTPEEGQGLKQEMTVVEPGGKESTQQEVLRW
jgi:hypothetical protein